MKHDIQTEADIRRIVDAFYAGITEDSVIGSYFKDVDMEAHLPKLYAFWSSVVFQTGAYRGRPFEKHVALEGLQACHFERWLRRLEEVVDAHHAGERAERLKARAHQVGTIFQIKLGAYAPDEEKLSS